jgi:phage-related minor tail protein
MSNGEEFFKYLFEEKIVYNIILQHQRSKTKTMMKQKGKAFAKELVEKLVKNKTMFKVNKNQQMLQWMKMDSLELKWAKRAGLKGMFNL